ncbi:MAG: hypothetical protein ABIH46_10550, partial [Chloroflexota bacterium]
VAWACLIVGEVFYVACWSKGISELWKQCSGWLVILLLIVVVVLSLVPLLIVKLSKKDCSVLSLMFTWVRSVIAWRPKG